MQDRTVIVGHVDAAFPDSEGGNREIRAFIIDDVWAVTEIALAGSPFDWTRPHDEIVEDRAEITRWMLTEIGSPDPHPSEVM